jgi:L-rhamnose isomerase
LNNAKKILKDAIRVLGAPTNITIDLEEKNDRNDELKLRNALKKCPYEQLWEFTNGDAA